MVFDPVEGLLPERVDPGVGLDRPGEVADVEEGRLAVAALPGHPAGDPVGVLRVLALAELLRVVGGEDLGDLGPLAEGSREGIDAFRAQPLGLGEALGLGGPLGRLDPGGRSLLAQGATPTVTRSPPM